MKKRTRSILDEIDILVSSKDKDNVIESRALHVITSAINVVNMIRENYDEPTAAELERRLLNSIRGQDTSKFVRCIRKNKQ